MELPPQAGNFGAYHVLGRRLTVRNRMPQEDIAMVLRERRMDLLFRQELLLQGKRP